MKKLYLIALTIACMSSMAELLPHSLTFKNLTDRGDVTVHCKARHKNGNGNTRHDEETHTIAHGDTWTFSFSLDHGGEFEFARLVYDSRDAEASYDDNYDNGASGYNAKTINTLRDEIGNCANGGYVNISTGNNRNNSYIRFTSACNPPNA